MNVLRIPTILLLNYLRIVITKQVKDSYDKDFKSTKKLNKIFEHGKIFHAHDSVGLV